MTIWSLKCLWQNKAITRKPKHLLFLIKTYWVIVGIMMHQENLFQRENMLIDLGHCSDYLASTIMKTPNALWETVMGKHFATYTRCCTCFFDFLAHFAMQLFLFLDRRLDFCRIGPIYHQSFSNKLKYRKYIPFSFAWFTHILSTAWPKANRKIWITAKIHIIWVFSLNGLHSAENIQIYWKAEYMFNMTERNISYWTKYCNRV